MPSPFPGMDPYLEAADIWPDFHHALASEIRGRLNTTLPSPYYARLEMRPEVGVVEDEDSTRRIIPDVAVVRHSSQVSQAGTAAVLESPRTEISRFFEFSLPSEAVRHYFVEVRDPSRGHKLITLIEIVSPSNKRGGFDQDSYRQKQQEVLASDASLIEIDLLRSGVRLIADPSLAYEIARLSPSPDYLVIVNRAWKRREMGRGYQIFPATVREFLPCFPVPLREGEQEVLLDLQFAFNRAYDEGPYRRGAVDYSAPLQPPLAEADRGWAAELLKAACSS